jgi:biopolymer transport protein ExbD
MWRPSHELARRAAKRRSRYYSGVHVSAFAGVMVVILFLFLTHTTDRRDLLSAVDLPKAQYTQLEPGALREDAITVTVERDGKVLFRVVQSSSEELPTLIRGAMKQGAERKVFLSADSRARNEDVEAVVQQVRIAGINSIAIVTNEDGAWAER